MTRALSATPTARLRQATAGIYLAGSTRLACGLLRGRSGRRDFRRVVVVAALGRCNGITAGARLQCEALREFGVEAELLDATAALRNPLCRIKHRPGTAYIFHSGGPQTANLVCSVLPAAAYAYRIAYWAWELPDPPLDWKGSDRVVSEVWVPSAFSRASLSRLTDRPIHAVPHNLPILKAREPRVGDPFTVLVMADSRSSLTRKNVLGSLRAFGAAFGESPSARLLLKLSGRGAELDDFEREAAALLRAGNVQVVREFFDDAGLDALYRSADVLLSMHRAEGLGLTLWEMMGRGIPVVATGWSGNLEFMNEANSCLVPYRLTPVSDASDIYGGSMWAEPDLDAAAAALRQLASDPALYASLCAKAHATALQARPCFPFSVRAAQAEPAYV